MKTRNKALLLTFGAVLLVAASVFGTLAYLTSTDEVVNTFTVGSVAIKLDEAKVTPDGKVVEGAEAGRVKENSYKLMPGHTYSKDPTVHVDEASESCYVFVKVENGISAFEAATETTEGGYKKIADQIKAKGWTALTEGDNVYYKEYDKNATPATRDFVVFENFKIADNANNVEGWAEIEATTTIKVTAYAIQADGFDNADDAWDAFQAQNTPAA